MFDDIFYELKLVGKELLVRMGDYWVSSKRTIIAFGIIGLVGFVGLIIGVNYIFKRASTGDIRITAKVPPLSRDEVHSLKTYLNPYHVLVGRTKGIGKPFPSQEMFFDSEWSNVHSNNLEEVEDCDNYEVTKSVNSVPYLMTDAKEFLDEVGDRFAKRLDDLGQKHYRFKVNSLLRTLQDQKTLQRSNPNAAKTTSSHLYGRSFDIAESKFFEGDSKDPRYSTALRVIILRELLAMQREGKCYVILEDVTNCIHVTVR